MARLDVYAAELLRWNRAINLVAPRSLDHLWQRHFLDSWQVFDLVDQSGQNGAWVDLGSGGGFPGLVAAACGATDLTLVESDQRKSIFLRETARRMDVSVEIVTARIEDITFREAQIVTARALAPLPKLLDLAARFGSDATQYIFLKGQDVDDELTEATKYWSFDLQRYPSRSDSRGTVLLIGGLATHDAP